MLELQQCRFQTLGGEGEYDWRWKGPTFSWYIYWFDAPGAAIGFDGKTWPLGPDRLMLIAPDTVVAGQLAGGRVGHVYMHVQLFFPYDHVAPGVHYAMLPDGMRSQLERLKGALEGQVDRIPDASTLFLAQSIALFGFSALPSSLWPDRELDPAMVSAVMEMEQHPERSYSNEALAAAAHMSLSTFLRRFKRATKCTPHRFLMDKRLEKARVLLGSTEWLLDDVAEACGFSDRFSLTRQFQSRYKASPTHYRSVYRDRS